MGQKVNPIAVRLNFNRFSDSSWFSDYYYSRLIYQDYNFRQYLNSIKQPNANKLGFRAARCIIHHFPKKTLIHLFCLSDPRAKVVETLQKRPDSIPLSKFVKANEVNSLLGSFVVQRSRFESARELKPPIGNFHNKADVLINSTESLNFESGYKNINDEDCPNAIERENFSIYKNNSVAGKDNASKSKAEVSLYWLKSSILEKKRALINLHRGIAKSFTELRNIPIEEPSEKEKGFTKTSGTSAGMPAVGNELCRPLGTTIRQKSSASQGLTKEPSKRTLELDKSIVGQSCHSNSPFQLRPGWLFRLVPIVSTNFFDFTSILFSKKNYKKSVFSECADVKNLHGIFWSAINSTSDTKANSLDYHLRIRSYFSFFALHYFFMRKTNSFHQSKHVQAPSLDGVKTSDQEMSALQIKSASGQSAPCERTESALRAFLCFSPNTLWPSLQNIYESQNCAAWQRLSLDWPTNASTTRNSVSQSPDIVFKSFLNMKRSSAKNKKYTLAENNIVVGQTVVRAHGPSKIMKSLDFYLSNVHFILSENSKTFISLRTIKVNSVTQSAFLVAQEVACKLEQKKSFRLICRLIFQRLRASCDYIKGIRIACSGRLNGAEIAKTECRKFGETSLHIFSDKIDYAHTRASTPYGILGIKVWISYI